jgi:hypothetical protein
VLREMRGVRRSRKWFWLGSWIWEGGRGNRIGIDGWKDIESSIDTIYSRLLCSQ